MTQEEFLKIRSIPKEERTEEEQQILDLVVDRVIADVLEKYFHVPGMTLIFQENILILCQVGANFSAGEADDLRRAIGKKKIDLMQSYSEQFINQWNDNIGLFGEEVWDKIVGFAKYGFNKSHAVAYTLVSLMTANLQKEYFSEYMRYNYKNLDTKFRPEVIRLLLDQPGASISFPGSQNPFSGIKIGDIEFKEINTEIDDRFNPENMNIYELFLSDIDSEVKLQILKRGVFDEISKDIKGLVQLKKGLGVKQSRGNLIPLDNVRNLKDFLNTLQLAGWLKYEEIDPLNRIYRVTTKAKPDPNKESDYFMIHSDISTATKDKKNYRVKCIVGEFGVYKNYGLSPYPERELEKVLQAVDKMNKVIERVYETNPKGFKMNSNQYKQLCKKVPKIYSILDQATKDASNENTYYTVYVKDKKINKQGLCTLIVGFSNNDTRKFYTRDNDIKIKCDKNDLIDLQIIPKQYIGRNDGMLKSYNELKLVNVER